MITYAKYFCTEISIFSTSKFLELTLHYRYFFQSRFLQFVKNTNLFTLFDKHCFDIISITETWEIMVIGARFDNRCGSSTSIVVTTSAFDNRCGSSTPIVVTASRRHIDRGDRRRDNSPNNVALGRLVYVHKNERTFFIVTWLSTIGRLGKLALLS